MSSIKSFFTPERIAIYFTLIAAIVGTIITFNTRYCALLYADEILTREVCQLNDRVDNLEQINKDMIDMKKDLRFIAKKLGR